MPRRELWKELAQADHHGVYRIDRIAIEHDGRAYAYGYGLTLGRLFVADGMR